MAPLANAATAPSDPAGHATAPARVAALLGLGQRCLARGLLIGRRLDLRALHRGEQRAPTPLIETVGEGGLVFLFRYGAVVLVNVSDSDEAAVIDRVRTAAAEPYPRVEREDVWFRIDGSEAEGVASDGDIRLRAATLDRVLVVADILAKSVALAYDEERVARVFDHVEPVAENLRRRGARLTTSMSALLGHMGDVLATLHRMVGRVEVAEKPDFLWDHPELERLYARLQDEYELKERDRGLTRKLDLLGQTVSACVDLLQARRSLRVEWYIVILIVIEIVLSLIEKLA
jgi:uncharacterized Rmd1/YagE family protein